MTSLPDHPIKIEPAVNRWRAYFAGHVIADTNDALILKEANLRPVVYFPREDVAMEYMSRTDAKSHCPFKGEAGCYTLLMDGEWAENVAWSYDTPQPGVSLIAGRIAFYPDRVEVYEVDDAKVNPRHVEPHTVDTCDVDEVIQHTDAGDGHSQREHWPPNVELPGEEEPR